MALNLQNQAGARIAAARAARRMTQGDLAAKAHLSLSLLSKIEQGTRPLTDRVLDALADALRIEPEQLAGARGTTRGRVHACIPAIRFAADAYDLPTDGPVRPLTQLRTVTDGAVRLRLAAQYARLGEQVPPLIEELTRAVHTLPGAEKREAAALLGAAYRSADAIAYKYGYHDLSARLVELMRWAAALAEDPLAAAAAAYVRTEVFFAHHNLEPGLRALEAAADAIPMPMTADRKAALGALHMRSTIVAARLGKTDAVRLHLEQARRLASGVREGVYQGTAFGPASQCIHEVAVAVELGDGARAVEIADRWAPGLDVTAERRSHYYIDLARAHLWLGRRHDAFASLQAARRIAPQHARAHPHVRESLLMLLRLHRSPGRDLIGYAEWAHAV